MSYVDVLCAALLLAQGTAGLSDKERPLRVVGVFTDFRETGEHVYGYQLQIWRRTDGTVLGLLSEAEGQPADFPTTRLEQVELEERTGRLHFTAPWCDQRLTFDGRIDGNHLRGKLERTKGDRSTKGETIELHRRRVDLSPVRESDWEKSISEVLRRLKPRCR